MTRDSEEDETHEVQSPSRNRVTDLWEYLYAVQGDTLSTVRQADSLVQDHVMMKKGEGGEEADGGTDEGEGAEGDEGHEGEEGGFMSG